MDSPEGQVDFLAIIRQETAKAVRKRPPGVTWDDLESAGNEGAAAAAQSFDPGLGIPLESWVRQKVRFEILSAIRAPIRNGKELVRQYPVDPETGGDVIFPSSDGDPADIAAARELLRPPARVSRVADALPSPAEVAARVQSLRAALVAAISPEDVADVVAAQVEKAKAGNTRAAEFVVDLIGARKVDGHPGGNNQTVFVNVQDVS